MRHFQRALVCAMAVNVNGTGMPQELQAYIRKVFKKGNNPISRHLKSFLKLSIVLPSSSAGGKEKKTRKMS